MKPVAYPVANEGGAPATRCGGSYSENALVTVFLLRNLRISRLKSTSTNYPLNTSRWIIRTRIRGRHYDPPESEMPNMRKDARVVRIEDGCNLLEG